ncbi:MAG: septal ring lytic transglycosylase RlpA family protein [Steroidobacteraceae bacterium]
MRAARGAAGVALCCLALLGGCAHRPARRASPLPPLPTNLDAIPDAIPRVETRTRAGNPPFYEINGRRYVVLSSSTGFVERGVASWYGPGFHGLKTAMGEPYDMLGMTAAHPTLPLPTYARVTNLSNGRSVVVRINDRGPFVANRIIDLSYTAAAKLDMIRSGTAFVEVRALEPGEPLAPSQNTLDAPVPINAAPAVVATPAATPDNAAAAPALTAAIPETTAIAADPIAAPVLPDLPAQPLYIQVGAFSDATNADRAVQRLQAAGISNTFILPLDTNGQRLRRIRVGPIASVADYDALVRKLATLGFPQARLAQD